MASKVAPQCLSPPEIKVLPSEQGEVVLLDDDPVMDVYNISFDELQQNSVEAQRKHFRDDHTSPEFMKERVIVSDVRKRPSTMTNATMAYARATSSNVKFLLAENKQMAKNLQATR